MQPIEIVILVLAVLLVGFTVVFNVIRKKKGKGSCGCDCASKRKRSSAGEDSDSGNDLSRGSGFSCGGSCGSCPYGESCHGEKKQ